MVRFGIAGFGLHAVKRLMPGFARSKKCHITALTRRTMAAAQQSAAEYSIPYAFDSVEDPLSALWCTMWFMGNDKLVAVTKEKWSPAV